jgi:hypothetical protein
MRRGPQVESISLTPEESNRLLEWTRRHKTSQALALRARIVLACQLGRSDGEVARELRVTRGPWASGAGAFRALGLRDCSTNPVPARHALLAMRWSSK